MIPETEVRRNAGKYGIDPMLIEKDYILGCYLSFLGEEDIIRKNWVFKGGTCLRKCYFEDYRFSEDLDFTLKSSISEKALLQTINSVNSSIQSQLGIRLDVHLPAIEAVSDEYGKESYEVRIYYRGPWQYRGSPPSIRIHLNGDEVIAFPVRNRAINHSYSDAEQLPNTRFPVYSLEEILVEKLRAISGQRRFVIARDMFDIYFVVENGADIEKAIKVYDPKCRIKNISPTETDFDKLFGRKKEFELDWGRNLEYLVPHGYKVPFQTAWDRTVRS